MVCFTTRCCVFWLKNRLVNTRLYLNCRWCLVGSKHLSKYQSLFYVVFGNWQLFIHILGKTNLRNHAQLLQLHPSNLQPITCLYLCPQLCEVELEYQIGFLILFFFFFFIFFFVPFFSLLGS